MENPPGTSVRQLPAVPEIRSAHLWSGVVAFFAWAFGAIVLVAALGGGVVQVSTYGATLNVLFPLWLLAGSALVLSWAIAIGRYRRELLRLDSQSRKPTLACWRRRAWSGAGSGF